MSEPTRRERSRPYRFSLRLPEPILARSILEDEPHLIEPGPRFEPHEAGSFRTRTTAVKIQTPKTVSSGMEDLLADCGIC